MLIKSYQKLINSNNFLLCLTFAIIIFIYFFDIHNIEALRQGTEGLYLQISKEMFNRKSFITPIYLDYHHWSKPPLHFWLPMPLYYLFKGPSILLARSSTAITSIIGLYYIAKWSSKHLSIDKHLSLIFFASCLGFFKYSRIFMMEIPLTIFSTLACLKYYDYIDNKKRRNFFFATLLLGLSILIKGPVSLIMCGLGCGLYLILQYLISKKNYFISFFLWTTLSIIIAGIWFFLAYLENGVPFLESFFLRENLGKFTAQSYPIRSVFQGLFIYGLPWVLLFPISIYYLIKQFNFRWQFNPSNPLIFLIINFLTFFLLWLIPSQRSHHYAIPSLPFFLAIILATITIKNTKFRFDEKAILSKLPQIIFTPFSILILILLIILPFTLRVEEIFSNGYMIARIIFTMVILVICLLMFIRKTSIYNKSLFFLITVWVNWSVLVPAFYLPLVPERVVTFLKDKNNISVIYRKPYFIEERLSKKIMVYNKSTLLEHLKKAFSPNEYFIVHKKLYDKINLNQYATIIDQWPVWRRGNNIGEFKKAFKGRKLESLQENLVLIKTYDHN